MSRDQSKRVLYAVAVLFFLSGISGLIYQVLWLRLLSLVFGVTTYAASAVLASFMGGLALGSSIGGRIADRARSPLLWYALIELLIGLSALLSASMLNAVESLYAALYSALPSALAVLTIVRFVLSSLVLLIPTTMMGMTLPMVIKCSLIRDHHIGERVAFLYAANTAGAYGYATRGFCFDRQFGNQGVLRGVSGAEHFGRRDCCCCVASLSTQPDCAARNRRFIRFSQACDRPGTSHVIGANPGG